MCLVRLFFQRLVRSFKNGVDEKLAAVGRKLNLKSAEGDRVEPAAVQPEIEASELS